MTNSARMYVGFAERLSGFANVYYTPAGFVADLFIDGEKNAVSYGPCANMRDVTIAAFGVAKRVCEPRVKAVQ